MIPPLLEKRLASKKPVPFIDIPPVFTLGRGHMKFWLDKFKFLETRFTALTKEMQWRGFNPDLSLTLEVVSAKQLGLYNDYNPRYEDIDVSRWRIVERIFLKPTWYRFHRKPISYDWVSINYFPEQPLIFKDLL